MGPAAIWSSLRVIHKMARKKPNSGKSAWKKHVYLQNCRIGGYRQAPRLAMPWAQSSRPAKAAHGRPGAGNHVCAEPATSGAKDDIHRAGANIKIMAPEVRRQSPGPLFFLKLKRASNVNPRRDARTQHNCRAACTGRRTGAVSGLSG